MSGRYMEHCKDSLQLRSCLPLDIHLPVHFQPELDVKPGQIPITHPQCRSLNEALRMDRLPGTKNAAPTPCMACAITSPPMFGV